MKQKRSISSHKTVKYHVKKGDTVVVLSGEYKGKEGEVLEVMRDKYAAIVKDINLVKKHQKPAGENPGGIVEQAAPLHLSKLAVVDPKGGGATRIGRKVVDGKSTRYSKKSGEIIK